MIRAPFLNDPTSFAHRVVTLFLFLLFGSAPVSWAQQPTPTEQKVQNPIGEAEAERRALRRNVPGTQLNITARVPVKPDEELIVTAQREEGQGNVLIYSGDVHLTYSDITIISDRVTFNKAANETFSGFSTVDIVGVYMANVVRRENLVKQI